MWINGQPDDAVSAADRGLHYGDGLFETIRVASHQGLLLTEHLQRLEQGCLRLSIPFPTILLTEIQQFLTLPAHIEGVLKVIVTRGGGGRGYRPPVSPQVTRILQFHPLPADLEANAIHGITAIVCDHPVSINARTSGLKTLNRLDQVLASRELSEGISEGLMTDGAGRVIEGTRSNLFAVINGILCTPHLNRAGVAGIMRAWLIDQLAQEDVTINIRDIACAELEQVSELFVCNSVFGVWPITTLQMHRALPLPVGPVSYRARQLFRDILP